MKTIFKIQIDDFTLKFANEQFENLELMRLKKNSQFYK